MMWKDHYLFVAFFLLSLSSQKHQWCCYTANKIMYRYTLITKILYSYLFTTYSKINLFKTIFFTPLSAVSWWPGIVIYYWLPNHHTCIWHNYSDFQHSINTSVKVGIPFDFFEVHTKFQATSCMVFPKKTFSFVQWTDFNWTWCALILSRLKTTKEEYLWNVQRFVVLHWCSIKILLTTLLQEVTIKIFWLSINKISLTFGHACITNISLL